MFDEQLAKFIHQVVPSKRNQLEITDVLNLYIQLNSLSYSTLNGYWQDAGTYDNLLKANIYWAQKKNAKINE